MPSPIIDIYFEKDGKPYDKPLKFTINCYGYTVSDALANKAWQKWNNDKKQEEAALEAELMKSLKQKKARALKNRPAPNSMERMKELKELIDVKTEIATLINAERIKRSREYMQEPWLDELLKKPGTYTPELIFSSSRTCPNYGCTVSGIGHISPSQRIDYCDLTGESEGKRFEIKKYAKTPLPASDCSEIGERWIGTKDKVFKWNEAYAGCMGECDDKGFSIPPAGLFDKLYLRWRKYSYNSCIRKQERNSRRCEKLVTEEIHIPDGDTHYMGDTGVRRCKWKLKLPSFFTAPEN